MIVTDRSHTTPRWFPLALALTSLLFLACQGPSDGEPGSEAEGQAGVGAEAEGSGEPGSTTMGAVEAADASGWSATMLAFAAPSGAGVVEIQAPGSDSFVPLAAGEPVPPGSVLRTNGETQASFKMSDGGVVTLDRGSELELVTGAPRTAGLRRGQAIFDLPPLGDDAPHAHVRLPTGEVELLGTKIAAVADPMRSLVTVSRGVVQAVDGLAEEVRKQAGPGEEIALPKDAPAELSAAPDLGAAIGWATLGEEAIAVPRGLGSLTAKQPGRSNDAPLKKVSQTVDVKINGLMAYTEVTEVFHNETGQTLEGVYRFPLPDDAQISRLALVVGDRVMEGQFIENARAERIWKTVISQWRDPAWLKWQHGNQFELRIFPIEPNQKRQVTIGYTQRLTATSNGRAYVYPMPVDQERKMEVDRFEFAAAIRGHDPKGSMQVAGYAADISLQQGDAATVSVEADAFAAAGDLVIRYPLDGEHDLRAVAYQDPKRQDEPGFATVSIRPELPRAEARAGRDIVLVADRSYSRTGESAAIQAKLLGGIVAEMAEDDRLVAIACNETCVPVGNPEWHHPAENTALQLKSALERMTPEGATNVLEAVRVSALLIKGRGEESAQRVPRIVYLTDGVASAGALDPGEVREATGQALAGTGARLTVVDLGGNRDALVQSALAEGGAGSIVELAPGTTLVAHALSVLSRQYGAVLTEGRLTLPSGLEQVFPDPDSLPPLEAGTELVVNARVTSAVNGDVVLSGRVDGKPFSQTFPLGIQPTTNAANSFTARLWAEQQIRALELAGSELHRREIVQLSQRFGLLSRHTSLLALESKEMMREFGVEEAERTEWDANAEVDEVTADAKKLEAGGASDSLSNLANRGGPRVTGALDSSDAEAFGLGMEGAGRGGGGSPLDGLGGSGSAAEPMPDSEPGTFGTAGRPRGGLGDADAEDPGRPEPEEARRSRSRDNGSGFGMGSGKSGGSKKKKSAKPKPQFKDDRSPRWRTVRVERATISEAKPVGSRFDSLVARRSANVQEDPTSVTRRKALVRGLSMAERLDDARTEAQRWLDLDPMDAEALVVTAEIEARQGHADVAERLLASAVDAQPRAKWLRERLAGAYRAIGNEALACAHRVSLADADRKTEQVNRAIDCPLASDLSWNDGAHALVPKQVAPAVEVKTGRSDMTVTLEWSGFAENPQGLDLDIGLMPKSGRYTTWLGGEEAIFEGVDGGSSESMSVRDVDEGVYRIDVVRRDAGKGETVRARMTVEAKGESRTIDVVLDGRRATVAEIEVEEFSKRKRLR